MMALIHSPKVRFKRCAVWLRPSSLAIPSDTLSLTTNAQTRRVESQTRPVSTSPGFRDFLESGLLNRPWRKADRGIFDILCRGFCLIAGVGEIHRRRASGSHLHRLLEWAVALLPCVDRVRSRRNTIDLKRSGCVADGEVRIRHHADISHHPAMDIATETHHDFFILHLEGVHNSGAGLPEIELVVTIRHAVDVVQQVVAITDLQHLPHANTDYPGTIKTVVLIHSHRSFGDRS